MLIVIGIVGFQLLQPKPAGQEVVSEGASAAAALQSGPASSSLRATSAPSSMLAAVSQPSPSDQAAEPTTSTAASETPAPPPESAPTPGTAPSLAAEPAPAPPAAPASVPVPVPVPTEISLPSLGVSAPVVSVGVEADGLMAVPANVQTVGWYQFGPAPGDAAGSAVISGHVDDRVQGEGVFARIGDLAPGDTIQVTDETGMVRTFSVIARESWPKSEVPLDRIFDRGGQPRLVLITCGGVFDRSSRNYEDNIAVTAVQVPS
ncbi:sortase [Nakamurella antarctica]|uniref:Sortase n=1 Tax=Nakamurella antarctica TaxID=1902245 RepID=A0A3G8ZPL2_9ACTN|nr:class F sortase [Nakamurella antarctica]AZI59078.1 sortase [Nakamurella antarctica]